MSSTVPARRSLPTRTLGLMGGGSLLAASAAAGIIATATPATATTYTVTNLDDSGTGSLRQAILDANGNAGADVIDFQPGLTGTITLTTGMINITDDVTITGAGSANVTVSGGGVSQIFYVYDGAHVGALTVTISGLTLTDGYDNDYGGGAIASWSADLTLRDVVVTDSTTVGGMGGAILQAYSGNSQNRNSHLTMENCVISGNSAVATIGSSSNFPGAGGGLALYLAGSADITDTIIENNTADAAKTGGGVFADQMTGAVNLTRTRISGNSALDGAGIRATRQDAAATMLFDRVSMVGNTSGAGGSTASFDHNAGSTEIVSSTIADNTGGGIGGMDATMLHLNHTTVAGNSGTGVTSANRGMNIDSSLLADNALGDLGSNADVNWSLVETPGAFIVAGANNITGTDPGLLPLLESSTTAWVRPFANTSAAFNAGDPAFTPPPATDQTGAARVAFGRIDPGAFELQPSTEPTTTTASDGAAVPTFTG